jgi:hypothetical protein
MDQTVKMQEEHVFNLVAHMHVVASLQLLQPQPPPQLLQPQPPHYQQQLLQRQAEEGQNVGMIGIVQRLMIVTEEIIFIQRVIVLHTIAIDPQAYARLKASM